MSSLALRRAILSSQSSATKHLCSALLANHSAITVTTGRPFSASSITPSPIFHYTSVSSTLSLSSTSSYAPRRFFSSKYPDHIVLSMPALSPTMTKGNLAAWRKNEGDKVKAGDVLADVETDKATVAFESVEEGYLAKILIQAGTQDLAVGVPVAVLCDNQADIAAFKDFSGAPKPAAAAPAKAAPAAAAATPAASSGSSAPAASASSAGGRVIASPLAKKTAAESGVDLSQVKGTGPSNRIVAADVNEFKAVARPAAAAPAPAAVAGGAVPVSGVDYIDTPVSNVRRVIAERLSYSKNTLPHYYVSVEVTMDKVMKLRAELNGLQGEEGVKMSVNDFIVKASALALRKIPAVNSAWLEGANAIRQYNYVDISVAVSTETGLITPIVKDADLKGLSMIASDTKALASKARSNKLQPHEFQGGTFTISNLGMFGVKHFTAIINPPQSCILAVGAADTRVIPNPDKNAAADKPFVTSSVMTVTLSSDHRVVDGAVAAQWLQVFKKYLENPTTMLL